MLLGSLQSLMQKGWKKEEEEKELRKKGPRSGRCKKEPVFNIFKMFIMHIRSSTIFGFTEPGAGKKKFEC